jgi:pilus assembly protein Flp/PilA
MDEERLTSLPEELLTRSDVCRPRGRGPEEGGVNAIRKTLRRLPYDQRGATAIEYGLIVALIALALMGGLRTLGGGAGGMWTNISSQVQNT